MVFLKKLLPLLTALLLLAGCAARTAAPAAAETTPPAAPRLTSLWTRADMPVSVRYDRMWVYSAAGESDDPELLAALVSAIGDLEIGGVSDQMTTDYTDILTFTFADGETLRLEFENRNVVMEDGTRYEVEGLGPLRALLDGLIDKTE